MRRREHLVRDLSNINTPVFVPPLSRRRKSAAVQKSAAHPRGKHSPPYTTVFDGSTKHGGGEENNNKSLPDNPPSLGPQHQQLQLVDYGVANAMCDGGTAHHIGNEEHGHGVRDDADVILGVLRIDRARISVSEVM